jgi:dynein heavy chain
MPEDQREPFYDWIAKDKEIVKVILLLTGSIQGTKNNVKKFLDSFEQYNSLWKQKPDESLKRFNAKSPSLEDIEDKLNEFLGLGVKVKDISSYHQIGALSLKTEHVQQGLLKWIEQWKEVYSKDLFKKAKGHLEHLQDDIKQIRIRIEKPAKDIDTLGNVMHALEEIRKKESDIELQFRPVSEMYNLLERVLPEIMATEEKDIQTSLKTEWSKLVAFSETVRNEL